MDKRELCNFLRWEGSICLFREMEKKNTKKKPLNSRDQKEGRTLSKENIGLGGGNKSKNVYGGKSWFFSKLSL